MTDKLVDRACALLDGKCNCECAESDCKYSGKPWPTVCFKQMTKDTCPYNPILGCDCGLNPPDPKR